MLSLEGIGKSRPIGSDERPALGAIDHGHEREWPELVDARYPKLHTWQAARWIGHT
jgi:hypothetical protein